MDPAAGGPLQGIRVVEFLGLGPAPFAGMLLADLGADVLTVARPGQAPRHLLRGRTLVEADVRDPRAADAVHAFVDRADVVIEGFRPGVLERLGFAPTALRERNPGLIVARMTGWGQTGPYALSAGHDVNYVAVTGALHVAARAGEAPVPPANLLGDFGAGGMYLVTAILAALVERARTGAGRDLDVAIVDGATYLTSMLQEYRADGRWSDEPGTNRLDTGAPYYDVYRTADDRYVAVGALEDKFFAELADILGLDADDRRDRQDPRNWPRLRERIAAIVATRTRDEWAAATRGTDACLSPVLSLAEAAGDAQVAARGLLVETEGGWIPRLPLGFATEAPPAGELAHRWGVDEAAAAPLAG
ncbi:MAG: CaiB/BaiF CoA-transferase family protein [Microbacterium sp.]